MEIIRKSVEKRIDTVPKILTVKSGSLVILQGYIDGNRINVYEMKNNTKIGADVTSKCGIIQASNTKDWILILPINVDKYCIKYDRTAYCEVTTVIYDDNTEFKIIIPIKYIKRGESMNV